MDRLTVLLGWLVWAGEWAAVGFLAYLVVLAAKGL